MDKYIKVKFTEEELERLGKDAWARNVRVNRHIHDMALGARTEITPIYGAFEASKSLAGVRAEFNKIVIRQNEAGGRLYDDDIIEMEHLLTNVEKIIADYMRSLRKEAE